LGGDLSCGLPAETIEGVLDFSIRVSSREPPSVIYLQLTVAGTKLQFICLIEGSSWGGAGSIGNSPQGVYRL